MSRVRSLGGNPKLRSSGVTGRSGQDLRCSLPAWSGLELVRSRIPFALPGMRIGLFGGSFDPPHSGHLHVSLEALKRCRLDRVWWLVSPCNPLKQDAPAPISERLAAARRCALHPRLMVSDLELELGTGFTSETLNALKSMYPGVRFVWIMGADNLVGFHLWNDWRWILENFPVAIVSRPNQRLRAAGSVAARSYRRFRLAPEDAGRLALSETPCWSLLEGPTLEISSSGIRNRTLGGIARYA